MAVGRDQVLTEIKTQWNYLAEIIARVPDHRMEGAVVVGTWSVKDLLGHISTWESETMENIARFLDPKIGAMRTYPDTDGFNEQEAEAKRAFPLADVTRDLEETHARLMEFLYSLQESALHQEAVSRRIKLDTYDHYKEHAETLRSWLESAGP